jgi:hypothetical protein
VKYGGDSIMQFRINFIVPVMLSLLFLIGIATISFDTIPCRASVKGSEPPVFSLDVKNQPLGKVLEKVSKMTGYEITVNKEMSDFPVTASFKNVSLYEGLRRILGSLNHSIISNDKEKTISVVIVSKDIDKEKKGVVSGQKKMDPKDETVTPPSSSGQPGLTRSELQDLLEAHRKKVLSKDDIVTPPSESGRGLTRGELENLLEANRKKILPKDEVVTPPSESGRGLTRGELQAIKEQQRQKIVTKDTVVTPPGQSGRGLTKGELEALLEAKK